MNKLEKFLRHLELWLTLAGVLVVWVAAMLLSSSPGDVWKVAAVAALAVSVLHGLIFWTVRHRQRKVRTEAIDDIREMLSDVVLNQLAIIRLSLPEQQKTAQEDPVQYIGQSIQRIETMVDAISEESLQSWQSRYDSYFAAQHQQQAEAVQQGRQAYA